MARGDTSWALGKLSRLCGFVFDLDGTIWEGTRLLPGAVELCAELKAAGLAVVFASNCSRHGSEPLRHQLADLGIATRPSEVVSAFDLVGDEIRRRLGPVRVLAIGTEDLAAVLESCDHTIVPVEHYEQAQAVVVGVDPEFSYGRLRAAARAVDGGAAFFAINLDARFPIAPGVFDPGCGALAEAIAVAGGARPTSIGKPELPLFRVAIERLGCPAERAAMVGDSTQSDIRGGRAAGMFTIWLHPDVDERERDCVDLKVGNLEELRDLWRKARTH
jgi:4-nitrophenyl phosphatase